MDVRQINFSKTPPAFRGSVAGAANNHSKSMAVIMAIIVMSRCRSNTWNVSRSTVFHFAGSITKKKIKAPRTVPSNPIDCRTWSGTFWRGVSFREGALGVMKCVNFPPASKLNMFFERRCWKDSAEGWRIFILRDAATFLVEIWAVSEARTRLDFLHNFALSLQIVRRYLKHLALGRNVAITEGRNGNATAGINRAHMRKLVRQPQSPLRNELFVCDGTH